MAITETADAYLTSISLLLLNSKALITSGVVKCSATVAHIPAFFAARWGYVSSSLQLYKSGNE